MMISPRPRSSWSRQAGRAGFLAEIDGACDVLEIGPFARPALSGPRVRYADVMGAQGLRARAEEIGRDPVGVPMIDYVTPNGDLSEISERFDVVFSAHCLEHQPDLIHHLRQVAALLRPGGTYRLILPDKRYCFDHFLPESLTSDVLQAHHERRRVHTLKSVIDHCSFTAHRSSLAHWLGWHGPRVRPDRARRIRHGIRRFRQADGAYLDVHAWQFTPWSFLRLIEDLAALEVIPLHLHAVWHTRFGRFEFMAVLKKGAA